MTYMLLTEKRPLQTPMAFGGRSFFINMSYENILTVLEILDDEELNSLDKASLALQMLTGEKEFEEENYFYAPENVEFAQDMIKHIFDTMIIDDSIQNTAPVDVLGNPLPVAENKKQKSFDFKHDAKYIYSSFIQAYGMDLYEEHGKLHWERFLALFHGLPENTIMMKIMNVRERELPTGKGTSKEREELKKAKRQFALPGQEIEEDED